MSTRQFQLLFVVVVDFTSLIIYFALVQLRVLREFRKFFLLYSASFHTQKNYIYFICHRYAL